MDPYLYCAYGNILDFIVDLFIVNETDEHTKM